MEEKQAALRSELGVPEERIPRHVAIIMDGNGRWGTLKGLSRGEGHRAGMERLCEIVRLTQDLGIRYLTIYAFGSDNWKRPRPEVSILFSLLEEYFHREIDALSQNGVRIKMLGERTNIPKNILSVMDQAVERTSENPNLTFNIAFNYDSRTEMIQAVRSLAAELEAGRIAPSDMDATLFAEHLYTRGQPDPDVLIRTSGEQRISNFLLYQLAYTELVFVKECWPDFSKRIYFDALREYAGRNRRFGGL